MDLDLVLRTSGVLLSALLLTRLMRRASAASRHLLWHVAVIAVLLAPLVSPLVPRFSVPMPQQLIEASAPGSSAPNLESAVTAITAQSPVVPRSDILAGVLLVGSSLLGGWFAFGWLASGWQAARGRQAPLEWIADAQRLAARVGVTELVPVRQSMDEGSPRVVGFFKPVILLPSAANGWTPADREAALLHELAHVRRGDRRTQAIAQAACALYWFNPLVWMAARALSRERERACDEEVLRAGIRPSDYASLLLGLARGQHLWSPAAALGMARPSTIEGRLLAILSPDTSSASLVTPQRGVRSTRLTRWVVIIGGAAVTTAMLGAQQQASPVAASAPAVQRATPSLLNLDDQTTANPVTQALTRALDDSDSQVREKAALGLALVPGSESIAPLLTALRDSDAQVREKAAIGLAFRRDDRIVDRLLNAMADSDSQVREKVAIALGASGDARAIGVLEKALTDPDAQVREKAASGLILLGLRK